MDVKGQGALEYLLLIGGAVLVAAIVIALISGMPSELNAEARTYCGSYQSFTECSVVSDVVADVDIVLAGNCCAVQLDGSAATDQADMSSCLYFTGVCP